MFVKTPRRTALQSARNAFCTGLSDSMLAGNNCTAMPALYFLDIAGGAEPERHVNDAKIMPPQPAEQATDSTWHF
jgi:hypothetical protein